MQEAFERGAVIVSIDTERIWGYLDSLSPAEFDRRFPDAAGAHEKLLVCLRAAAVSATWFVVGGLALRECAGAGDPRLTDLSGDRGGVIPAASEATAPLWFCPSFIERLRNASPRQEIGLHGGLTHLIWTGEHATRHVVRRELAEGIRALEQLRITPHSFSFARNQEAHHDLLARHGIRSFRGRPPGLSWQLGRTLPGAMLRAMDEVRCATPPPVWPQETTPGLWNIPASMFLYPLGAARARWLGLRSRVDRFARGLEAAARHRAIFHFCLHPENVAESPHGFSLLEEILEKLSRARDRGDIEILTISDVVARMERKRPHAAQIRQSLPELFKAHRRP